MNERDGEVRSRFVASEEQRRGGLVGPPPESWSTTIITDYDPAWPDKYRQVEATLTQALADEVVSCEHVGSTSVPGLAAKPVLDIDLTVRDCGVESSYVPALGALGYRLVLREPWWQEHRMLVQSDGAVNVHVWPPGAAEPKRHLLFRDWLRRHPADRDLYAVTKRHLATEVAPQDYSLAKNRVIDEIFERIFAPSNRVR